MEKMKKAIITGGGTGGHIYPALTVASALIARGWDILYLGSTQGLESRLIPEEGIDYISVEVSALPRKISPAILSSLYSNTRGFFQARRLIGKYRPDLVLGTGGFVTGPVVLAASLLKIPTVIHEQNVYPGLTNRLLSYRVNRIALNFAAADSYFSRKVRHKLRVTGNPVRDVILTTTLKEGLEKLGLKNGRKNLLVFGGSQGSRTINRAMEEILKRMSEFSSLQVIHITGQEHYNNFLKKAGELGIDLDKETNYLVIPYLTGMEFAYAVADLIVSRAGATGIAEITVRGIPAILIPYPYATGNHQKYNAVNLAECGAAVMIEDRNLTGELLLKTVADLIKDDQRLEKMKRNSRQLGQPDAEARLISLIEELV
jgi:UDP-N-acetylglucosamine--N-acetylmuramyl-(pentapeptide) pyrophosphoryl-undecaprenol N-acetylglucosamine transferase